MLRWMREYGSVQLQAAANLKVVPSMMTSKWKQQEDLCNSIRIATTLRRQGMGRGRGREKRQWKGRLRRSSN